MRRDATARVVEWAWWLLTAAWVMACAAWLTSCTGHARHTLRGGVLTMAHAARAVDAACAMQAKTARDLALADACAASYNVTRDALVTAESALDAWSDADQGRAVCAAAKGASALAGGIAIARRAGAKMSPAIVDGATVADILARGSCK